MSAVGLFNVEVTLKILSSLLYTGPFKGGKKMKEGKRKCRLNEDNIILFTFLRMLNSFGNKV